MSIPMRVFPWFLFSGALRAQQIAGELKQWHDIVLTFDGPSASEDAEPNPFLNYRLSLVFSKGNKTMQVPGYFAADGNAVEASATAGDKMRRRGGAN